MKKVFLSLSLLASVALTAQNFVANKTAHIIFDAGGTPIDDIAAESHTASAAYSASTNKLVFSVDIKSFTFENSLMQEHFNENYMESETYPKATFQGSITNGKAVGTLEIHGVKKLVTAPVTLVEKPDGSMHFESAFKVTTKDFKIKIPKIVIKEFAEEVEIDVKADLLKAN